MEGLCGATMSIAQDSLIPTRVLGELVDTTTRLRTVSYVMLVGRTQADIEKAESRLEVLTKKVNASLDEYAPMVGSPEEAEKFRQFKDALASYLGAQDKLRQASIAQRDAELSGLINRDLKRYSDQMAPLLQWLLDVNRKDSDAAVQDSTNEYVMARNIVIAVLVLTAIMTILLAIALTRSIVRPLDEAVQAAEHVASGDLTQTIKPQGRDEVSRLQQALKMQINLRDTLQQISRSATQVASAAEELNAVTEEGSRSLEQQSNEIEQAATAVNEMTAAVEEVASNAVST